MLRFGKRAVRLDVWRPAGPSLRGPRPLAPAEAISTPTIRPQPRLRDSPLRRRDTSARNRSNGLEAQRPHFGRSLRAPDSCRIADRSSAVRPRGDAKLKESLNDARVKESGPEPAPRKTKPNPATAGGDLGFGVRGRSVGVARHWSAAMLSALRTDLMFQTERGELASIRSQIATL